MQEVEAVPQRVGGAERVLANSVYRAGAELVSKVLSLALFAVMARELGAEGLGVFTFGFAFVTLVTALASFGQDQVLAREVSRRRELVGGYFGNTFVLKLLGGALGLAVALAAGWAAGFEPETLAVVALLGPAVLIEQLLATVFAVLMSFDRLELIPVVLLVQRTLTAAVSIGALLAGAGVVAVSAIYLGGTLLALGLALGLMRRRVVRPESSVERRRWRPLVRAALPIGISIVLGTILFRVDTVILAAFESASVVGQYGAAFRVFEATLFVSWAVGTATYAVFATASRTSEPTLAAVAEQGLKLAAAATLPVAAAALVLGEPITTLLYGAEFDEAGTALSLLAPAIAFYPVVHVLSALLIAQDRQRVVVHASLVAAAANVAGNLILIPALSLNGAALMASLTQVVLAVPLIVAAHRLAGPLRWRRVAAGPVLASAAAVPVMLALRSQVLAAGLAGAAVYVVALAAWERIAYPADARAAAAFVRGQR